ncbi:MAG: hypothetical protein MUP17_12760, partial [candidate division Zixibacteria bacterium]|nr:hypothetical protein [candidate division Zixibacteria bacterium]
MKVITKFFAGEDATAENFNLPLADADDNFDEADERLGTLTDVILAAEETIGTFEERIEELEGMAHEASVDDTYIAPVRRGYDEYEEKWKVDFSYSSDDFEYSDGAFRLKSPGIMPGTMIDYGGVLVPAGWLLR